MRSSPIRLVRLACRLALLLSVLPASSWAWLGIVDRPLDVAGSLIAYGPRGDVVVAGRTDLSGDQGRLTVARFSRSGRLRWQTTPGDVLTTNARSLAVDRAGGVYVAGAVGGDDEDTFGPFTVVKFDGLTGREAWRWRPNDLEGAAQQVVIDSSGDVLVAGHYVRPDVDDTAVGVVAKLDGPSGVPRWLIERPQSPAWDIALLPDGDAVTIEGRDVLRRSSATGQVTWQTPAALEDHGPLRVVVDRRADDVIAVTARGGISKLGGDDGAIRWQGTRSGFTTAPARVMDVAVDRYGDVSLCGRLVETDFGDFAVVKVAGDTGAELWRFIEYRDGLGQAVAVAVDGRGNVVATGQLEGYPSPSHLEVVQLDGRTGAVRWLHGRPGVGAGHDVVVDRSGRAAVSGFVVFPHPPPGDSALVAVQLSASGRGLLDPPRGQPHGPESHGPPAR